ncbi:MAG: glutamate--tRNA ligase [Oscillospiraceae bacterium]|nr:glutamate--tRNA ligase [Oscillospiraceae bacterium]
MCKCALAEALFPGGKTPEELELAYPERGLPEGAAVTRFSPSPTGFLHLGGLFGALTDATLAQNTGGVFYVRVEDTDKKREIADGVRGLLDGLAAYGLLPEEGVVGVGREAGKYGPYTQSKRIEIYHAYAKRLVEQGIAYPCFCTEERLSALRAEQEQTNVNTGYYGTWACCRDLPAQEQLRRLQAGEPYTLRLRSPGVEGRKITVQDQIKGKLELPENIMDVVLLKTNGVPTYHFAHAVDDHLMRTTHVIRGDEWVASLPLHIQLFGVLGFRAPKYCHTPTLMKEENGGKRKISKRKDPEAATSWFWEQGYPPEAVLEYLMTLMNSDFEAWRRAGPDAPLAAFPFRLQRMSVSGALFDVAKLTDVSKNVIARMSAAQSYAGLLGWANTYDPAWAALLTREEAFAAAMLDIDRGGKKPRKDLARWNEAKTAYQYFFDALHDPAFQLPAHIAAADAEAILRAYAPLYDPEDDKDAWFGKIRGICAGLGFCPDVKLFKTDPSAWKGHVGDASGVIRLAVTGRENTPDLCAVMRLLGGERVRQRLQGAMLQMAGKERGA